MPKYHYIVTVECESPKHAAVVMAGRLGCDEEYDEYECMNCDGAGVRPDALATDDDPTCPECDGVGLIVGKPFDYSVDYAEDVR